jgi:molybdopterin-guanine dinucleotide biosynthesis protein A
VLAGGRSVRFGSPKLEVDLDGASILEHAVRAAAAVASEVVVAGVAPPTGWSIDRTTIRVVADEEPFGGPLVALAGALRSTSAELAIVVGGDMPALLPRVLEAMLRRLAMDPDLAAATLEAAPDAPQQVLPLALRVDRARGAASDAVASGDRSLFRLVDRLRSISIPAHEWRRLDPGGNTLVDVDVPADLERLRATKLR